MKVEQTRCTEAALPRQRVNKSRTTDRSPGASPFLSFTPVSAADIGQSRSPRPSTAGEAIPATPELLLGNRSHRPEVTENSAEVELGNPIHGRHSKEAEQK